jgi:predicted CoA-binding protein
MTTVDASGHAGPGDERRRRTEAATADILDLEAGRIGVPVLDDRAIRDLLAGRPRVAMIGASPDPSRPSNGVLRELLALGFEVVPIHPTAPEVAGVRAFPTLAEATAATGPFGIVDVFRLPWDCPPHATEAVDAGARVLWLQLGIASREAGRIAHEGGLGVVMNRCLAVEAR